MLLSLLWIFDPMELLFFYFVNYIFLILDLHELVLIIGM